MPNQDKLHPTGLQCLDLLVSSTSTAIDSSRQQAGTNADAGETLTRKGRSVCMHQSSSSQAGKKPTTFVDSSTLIELMYKEPQQLSLRICEQEKLHCTCCRLLANKNMLVYHSSAGQHSHLPMQDTIQQQVHWPMNDTPMA